VTPLGVEPTRPISNPRIARLQRVLAEQPASSVRHDLAKAELDALSDGIYVARSSLHEMLSRSWPELRGNHPLFASALGVAFIVFDLEIAATMINRWCETGDWFSVGFEDNSHSRMDVIRWEIESQEHCKIWLDSRLPQTDSMEGVNMRLVSLLPLLAAYRTYKRFSSGNLFINVGDIGYVPGLAFCDSRPEYFLIPDAVFVLHRGYANMRPGGRAKTIPWDQRRPIGFWRGGTAGRPTDIALGWRSLPRVKLCEISLEHPDILDAGISHVGLMPNPDSERELCDAGIIRPFIPAEEFTNFKYQVDIDGNTNSWPGLFQKLLTGGPVLKVESLYGYRQWYYDRLRPWTNYVPIAGNMSDLVEKIGWLRANDDMARRIGENGQALALSLSYDTELKAAGRTIAAAARYFGGQSEIEIQFGPSIPDDVRLLDGWTTQREDGLPAIGQESRLELLRPVAAESFVLTLDVSPCTEPPAPPAQRLVIAVNGEILREAVLSARKLLRCRVPWHSIKISDRLTITLLHPDGASLSSESNPLDDRILSVVLHGITLAPVSVYARSGPAIDEILPPDPARPSRAPFQDALYGQDVWLPLQAKLGRVKTSWGTVIFADMESGTLRHGPEASSPNNVLLADDESTAYLFHITPSGERYTIRIAPDNGSLHARSSSQRSPGRSQALRVLPTIVEERSAFGLRSEGLMLCAESDGRVTLSRTVLGPWERFEMMDLLTGRQLRRQIC
jgi:Glycosyl transferase family 90